jgi:hypothetical protein
MLSDTAEFKICLHHFFLLKTVNMKLSLSLTIYVLKFSFSYSKINLPANLHVTEVPS